MSEFERHKFVAMMPHVIQVPTRVGLPGGAFNDFPTVTVDYFAMTQVWFTTNERVHGIFHYEGATQLFFLGYKCGKCNEVFLVPDTVTDEEQLLTAMQHGCTH